jgi:hypothetical protein
MASTWGASWGAFWGNSWGPITQPVADQPSGGGGIVSRYHPWIHGYEKRRKFLEKHQIPEEVAEAVVSAVAEHVHETSGKPDPDAITLAEMAAIQAVEEMDLAWNALYSRLIIIEYSRLVHEYEDAQIAWLLFEM